MQKSKQIMTLLWKKVQFVDILISESKGRKIKFFNREICVCAHLTQTRHVKKRAQKREENMAKNITVDNFEKEVLQAAGPVLVDFWATWCGPCRMQGPAVEKLAGEGYNVGKINVDDEGELAERYHVMNIPTLIIFKNGEEKERMVGVQSKDLLESKLKALA